MPTRKVPLLNNHFYHVYNKVVDGRKLFYSHENYIFYLKLWKQVDFSSCCRIMAYCLMPNHYHYLVQITDAQLFPRKLGYLLNKYLMSLNAERRESGRYFKDRFQAKLVDDEEYLITVSGYIHRNPLKAKLVTSLEEWPYSNYLEFVGKRNGNLWDTVLFDRFIQSSENYVHYLASRYSEEGLDLYTWEDD